MGKEGKKIADVNTKKLIKLLNKAYADEWFAFYQYWVGAKIAVGMMRPLVVKELIEHAGDELKHAERLAERITQLGGQPLLEPKLWYEETNCGYEIPSGPSTKTLTKQNLGGERCAIKAYKKMADYVKDRDEITHRLILDILEDEVEHEDELEAILEDMETR